MESSQQDKSLNPLLSWEYDWAESQINSQQQLHPLFHMHSAVYQMHTASRYGESTARIKVRSQPAALEKDGEAVLFETSKIKEIRLKPQGFYWACTPGVWGSSDWS